jgi:general stress protein YciG
MVMGKDNQESIIMGGTVAGGKKARDKILAKDPKFYNKIGTKGGQNTKGNFAVIPGLAKRANKASHAKKMVK